MIITVDKLNYCGAISVPVIISVKLGTGNI